MLILALFFYFMVKLYYRMGDIMGKYIVIEGTDCSGKETQSKLLEERLNDMGIKCKRFSFPMYDSPTGKIVEDCYLGKYKKSLFKERASNVDPYVASLYYAADRKYNMKEIIKYYDEGYYIILDRYTTSNLAYQGSKIENKEDRFYMYQWIDRLEYWLLKIPKPDITIYLHVPISVTKELLKNRKDLDDDEKDIDYLEKSEKAYLELTTLYGWNKIECTNMNKMRDVKEINDEILNMILKNKD